MTPWVTWLHTAAGRVRLWDWAEAVYVKVCQLLAVGRQIPPGAPVSSTSQTDIFIIIIISPLRYELAVAEAFSPNKPNHTRCYIHSPIILVKPKDCVFVCPSIRVWL